MKSNCSKIPSYFRTNQPVNYIKKISFSQHGVKIATPLFPANPFAGAVFKEIKKMRVKV
jgi:hypothetical protein